MFIENPNWEKCTEESNGLKYNDKGGNTPGGAFDHSRSDEGKWSIVVHVLNLSVFKYDCILQSPDKTVNSLKSVGGISYPLIPPDDNGRPVIIGTSEHINSTDNIIKTRYLHTGCMVKSSTDSSGAYFYDTASYVFKCDLVPPLYGIA